MVMKKRQSTGQGLGKASQPAQQAASRRVRASQPERHSLPASERSAVLRRDGYRCQLCGISQKENPAIVLEVDHITPVSKGGTNDPANLQALCNQCNRLKSNKV